MRDLLKISKQTFWQILGKVVSSLSTFIILGLVARIYGEEGTGVFTLSLTYLGIFYLLSDFGFNAHVLKKDTFEWQKLLGTRILWSLVLIGLAVGTLPFWPFANSSFSQAVVLGSLAIFASGIFVSANLIFQSRLRYDLSVLASSIGTIFGLVVFIYLVSQNLPIPFLLLGHLISWIVIALSALFLVRKLIPKISPIYQFSYIKNLLLESWPIAATLALNVVYFRADSFMISYFRSNAEVGIYNIAYSIFQTALVLPAFVMNAYYPIMLRSLKNIRLVGLGLTSLSVAGTIITLILAPFLVGILTGGGFGGSVESLRILSLGFPAYFLSALLMWALVAKDRYKTMLLIYGLGLLFNIFLNFIFIPTYSFFAASWITVISEYLILALQIMVLFLKV